ncbi:hypothetical protein HDG35_007049 [Paraburkholderia sp. JPY681]|uniref:Asparagine synthase (Glutamine-hydrolyzing) n=1 Tax=Paraburkholderia atlantica TaxID=2654982 RepID=D5WNE3_PARAM|nr:asparagine synthase (glutamine-hydrolyzing) [Paraburkholderia atlantica]MBB5510752.1 hypothetical protein [Paraburkholderia atlantica]
MKNMKRVLCGGLLSVALMGAAAQATEVPIQMYSIPSPADPFDTSTYYCGPGGEDGHGSHVAEQSDWSLSFA